jgi:hypothetical protein
MEKLLLWLGDKQSRPVVCRNAPGGFYVPMKMKVCQA